MLIQAYSSVSQSQRNMCSNQITGNMLCKAEIETLYSITITVIKHYLTLQKLPSYESHIVLLYNDLVMRSSVGNNILQKADIHLPIHLFSYLLFCNSNVTTSNGGKLFCFQGSSASGIQQYSAWEFLQVYIQGCQLPLFG